MVVDTALEWAEGKTVSNLIQKTKACGHISSVGERENESIPDVHPHSHTFRAQRRHEPTYPRQIPLFRQGTAADPTEHESV